MSEPAADDPAAAAATPGQGAAGVLPDPTGLATVIIDALREALLVLDPEWTVRAANRSFYDTFRRTPADTLGRSLFDLEGGPFAAPALRRLLRDLPPGGSTSSLDVEYAAAGARRRMATVRARRLHEHGLLLLTLEDVTERRRNQSALRTAEERYALLVEGVQEYAMLMLDPEGYITLWNRGAERIFGFSEEEAVGLPGSLIFNDVDRERGAPATELELARRDGYVADERWHVRKDGSRFWAFGMVTALHHEDGTLRGFAKVLRDNTKRKNAEDALRRSEWLLQATLEQMPAGVSIAEAPSGRLLFHNDAAVSLIRHPLLPSESIADYARYGAVHDDGTPYRPEEYPIARALKGETVLQEQMKYRRGDGTLAVFSVGAAPVRDVDGVIVRAVSTFEDITDRIRVEQELRQLNETLEERVEERARQVRQLASALTLAEQQERRRISQILHDDLQQQLYGIQMKMSVARKEAEMGSAERLRRHVADAEAWIRQCVALARGLTVELSPPILKGEGLADALSWLQTQMKELYELDVEIRAEKSYRTPEEDMRVLIFQIVRELLFNVVKHAGTDRVTVTLRDINHHVQITVEDEGKGFDVAAAEQRSSSGHSFGLFSARERLALFGGRLQIASAPGAGTRVMVDVPLRLE